MLPRKSDQLPADQSGDSMPPAGAAAAGAIAPVEHHSPASHGQPGWSSAKANLWIPIAILLLLPLVGLAESRAASEYNIPRLVTLIGYNVILAVSLQLINGVSGQFSLGHAGFMAMGAYMAAYPAKEYSDGYKDPGKVVLFYVAMGIVVTVLGGIVYGLLRSAALLKRVHASLPGVALLLLIVWVAVDISRAAAADDAGTPVPGWCVWTRGIGIAEDAFAGVIEHGGPMATRVSAALPTTAAQAICFVALLIGAGGCAAAVGLVVGLPTLRLRGDYLAIATLGMAEIIRIVIQNSRPLGGALGLTKIPVYTNLVWLYTCALLTVVAVWRVAYSARGRLIMAVREDEIAASAVGINTTRQKVTAFVMGAFFAGIAGALFAMKEISITPTLFNLQRSIDVVVMVTLGGLGSVSGAVIAAIVLTLLPEVLRPVRDYRMIIYSVLLIGMMLSRPQGLMGTRELPSPMAVWRWWRGRRSSTGEVTA